MDKKWLVGVFAVLAAVLVIFLIGYSSANSFTGGFFHGKDIVPSCGDGICNGRENLNRCAQDCHICGDGRCTADYEDSSRCVADCPCPGCWTELLGDATTNIGNEIVVDSRYNSYILGKERQNFGDRWIDIAVLEKLDNCGNLIFTSRPFYSTLISSSGTGLALSSDGSYLYAVGYYGDKGWVNKYDITGSDPLLIWNNNYAGLINNKILDVGIDELNGKVYVIGSGQDVEITRPVLGGNKTFLAAFDSSTGGYLWDVKFVPIDTSDTDHPDILTEIKVVSGSMTPGADGIYSTGIRYDGVTMRYDVWVSKLDFEGSTLWERSFVTSGASQKNNLDFYQKKLYSLYPTPLFTSVLETLNVDTGEVERRITFPFDNVKDFVISGGKLYLTFGQTFSGFSSDVVVKKYSNLGNRLIWTIRSSTSYPDDGNSIAVDSLQDVYVVGSTGHSLDPSLSNKLLFKKYNSDGTACT